jgi:hypothetical protein
MTEADKKAVNAATAARKSYEHLLTLVKEDHKAIWVFAAIDFIQKHESFWTAVEALEE